jgi:uncharacterized membrane protein YfcA
MIVGWFAAGSVLGVALAATVIVNLPARLLMVALALFILWSIWSPVFRAADIPVRGFSVVGAVTTFLSMFLGATGPLVAAFWNTARMGRQAVIATHGAVMTILHGLKVVTFALLGFSFAEWIPFLVAMVAAGQLGTFTGKHALANLPEEIFITVFKWALTLLALRLGYSGLFGVS